MACANLLCGIKFAAAIGPAVGIASHWRQDRAIGRTGVEKGEQYMKGPYRFVELDAGHWLIQEETERDRFLNAEEAVKYGIVDEVLSEDPKAAGKKKKTK